MTHGAITLILASIVAITASAAHAEGPVRVDGTSHLSELTKAWVEAAKDTNFQLTITNREAGTGGGFKGFSQTLVDINKAARGMKDNERRICEQQNLRWIELIVAHQREGTETLRLFVNKNSLRRESVRDFLRYCLSDHAQELAAFHATALSTEEVRNSRGLLTEAIEAAADLTDRDE
ncbi:type 2 periplasmic-binding domain-containing protein [Aporhodopirellula aestuarii]|uniref:PBP domain-containing protein n=1 Tax=Aporhodopirellula aestuarii TaxID=2950107 RepID=A0ABT0UAJ9_9BACT|nr:hypothetical protein [Aporhodopirellula aestuarii]MCM2373806.1 hypothetical protein [Aporhodopirellula aestuarii]